MRLLYTMFIIFIFITTTSGFSVKKVFDAITKTTTDLISPPDVCFDYLGCFSMKSPWRSFLRPIPTPHSPEIINTSFALYTRQKPEGFHVQKLPQVSLEGSSLDASKTVHVVIHGMASSASSNWVKKMKDALLTKYDGNVFLIDWMEGASHLNYLQDTSNTRVVGAEVARLLDHLITELGVKGSHIHLLGHSLGAHVASYVAKNITGIARITALDPAQPLFEGYDKKVRLDKSDAELVQVIHTNARPFLPYMGLGMIKPFGHLDFYMNEIKKYVACSHERACSVFIASLLYPNCTFWGHKVASLPQLFRDLLAGNYSHSTPDPQCTKDTCVPMGMEAIYYPARGVFDVTTLPAIPFCRNTPLHEHEMEAPIRRIASTKQKIW